MELMMFSIMATLIVIVFQLGGIYGVLKDIDDKTKKEVKWYGV